MRALQLVFIGLFSLLLINGCSLNSDKADGNDAHGKPIRLADYKGQWIVINYWATWCKPCLVELPELNTLYTSEKGKVMVLGVNYDQLSNQELIQFANQYQLNFPLLSTLSMQRYKVAQIATLPATFLIAPNGKLAKLLVGPQTKASLLNAIAATEVDEDNYIRR